MHRQHLPRADGWRRWETGMICRLVYVKDSKQIAILLAEKCYRRSEHRQPGDLFHQVELVDRDRTALVFTVFLRLASM